MATVKVFHRVDEADDEPSRHMRIEELVENYEYIDRIKFRVSDEPSTAGLAQNHAAGVFNKVIQNFTHGPGSCDRFLDLGVRGLEPGDVLIRSDTGESVIVTEGGYDVLDLKDVLGRVDSAGTTATDPETFPGYDPSANETFDPEEHTYRDFDGYQPDDPSIA